MPRKVPFQHRKHKLRLRRMIKNQASESSEQPSDSLGVSDDQSNGEPVPSTSTKLDDLKSSLSLPSKSWCDQSPDTLEKLVLVKLHTYGDVVQVTHTLTVNSDLTCRLVVNKRLVNFDSCGALHSFSAPMTQEKLSALLSLLDRLIVCCGQPDDHFVKMVVTSKKGKILSPSGKVAAFVDNDMVTFKSILHHQTVRTSDCEILSVSSKCSKCALYRNNLRTMYNRWSKKRSTEPTLSSSSESSAKHTNDRYLNTPEKLSKIDSLRKRAMKAESQNMKLREKIRKMTDSQGEVIDDDLNADLTDIMSENHDRIEKTYPEGSFARLFWEEQHKAASVSNSRQTRWHPVLIKWCLNLKLLSTSAYHALRTSGFIKLPSERTLYDYTHYFIQKPGFQDEVNSQLVDEVQKLNLQDTRKFVGLLVDEMKIKEDLVYNKHTGQIVGFTNLDDVSQRLLQLENEGDCPPVASHVLTIMVRGVFFKIEFPYAHFGTTGVTGEQMFSLIWETIRRLEACDIKVIFITADGASTNRKFFRMHLDKKDSSTFNYKAKNPYSNDDRWVYFIADPPHLLKTIRNCWSHSGYGGTRLMKVTQNIVYTSMFRCLRPCR